MDCQACGTRIEPESAACPRCGTPAGPALAAGPAQLLLPPPSYPLGGLATALTVLLGLCAAVSLGSVGLRGLEPAAGLLTLLLIPLFIVWFYRARKNAQGRGWRQRLAPGWAIGSWFVPVIFLWFPYQIMADIWRAGLPAAQRAQRAWLPGIWWACWLLAWFTGFRSVTTQTAAFRKVSTGFFFDGTLPSKLFAAAAAIVLIVVVRAVSGAGVGREPQPGRRGLSSRQNFAPRR